MSSTVFSAVILLVCALAFSAAQTSCRGRCGAEYYRGYMCQCDYTCLSYGECCRDFETQCTTRDSCKGRCGESFKRGRLCSCDDNCVKYKQCCSDFKNHCDAEEPTLDEATQQDSTYSEGDNADVYGQIYPDDGFSNTGLDDPEATPIPESTSGYGSTKADLVDQLPTEPTQDPDTTEISTETVTAPSGTQATLADEEPTQADDSPSTVEEDPTKSPDVSDTTSSGTTPPQPTTAAVSSRPDPPVKPQRGDSPDSNDPEPQTEVLPEGDISPEAQNTDAPVASTDGPEVTTLQASNPTEASASLGPTPDSSTVLENSQVTTTPALSTLDPKSILEATTSDLRPDDANTEDVTTGLATAPTDLEELSTKPDSLTTKIPTSTDAAQDAAADAVTPEGPTSDPLNVTPDPTKPTPSEATSKPQEKPDLFKPIPVKPVLAKPSSKPETKPLDQAQTLNIDDPRDYQADDSNDTNLCSGRPVSGVTTLSNGTIVVFRGHFFWSLDSHRVPSPARDITQVWGVPSPIDTVFTRCNCQGKTYIFKGSQYWRFENDLLDPGYPKVIQTGFNGLRGHITAALSVPQYQRRGESVYFFKRGGTVQKYSYQVGTTPSCNRKPQYAIYTVSNRIVRQAVSPLGPTINIRTSWRGFPPTITSAVSVPNNREPQGYKYYVFSRSKSYNVRMDGERPAIAAPAANTSPQSNNVFKCPKKV
uniref:proteoglycan 4b n=1 Tax=Semicossyphus pulcher TaxID=241346 RepID=UPI0037E7F2D4